MVEMELIQHNYSSQFRSLALYVSFLVLAQCPLHSSPYPSLGGANHLHTSPHPSSYPWSDHGNMSCPSALMRIFKVQRLDKRGTYEVSRILLTPAKSAIFILIDQHLFRITICNMYWINRVSGSRPKSASNSGQAKGEKMFNERLERRERTIRQRYIVHRHQPLFQ